jgi:bifunctional UDP-N-acetylglucosamine pyrophosphorylase/glucosamine-1-phosphate N-acetyltransferase
MKSDLPKVLHKIAGKTIIRHLMQTIAGLNLDKIVVVIGYQGRAVQEELADFDVDFVWQHEQLGTGHAVMMARDEFTNFDGTIIVAAGDVPFLSAQSINRLFEIHYDNRASATCLSAVFDDPAGYGRIVREPESDRLREIVEDKDADEEIKKITEINSGTFCFESRDLFSVLHRLKDDNAQQEYYLTDSVRILREQSKICAVWTVPRPIEVKGINSLEQLQQLRKEIKNN